MNKYYEQNPTISDDFKEQNIKYTLSKHEDDLYNDEDNIAFRVIRVKRIGMPARGEKWRIFEDAKVIFTIDGHKLTKKEKEFLRTIDGINFLMSEFKTGPKSFNAIKKAIKIKLKPKQKKKRT